MRRHFLPVAAASLIILGLAGGFLGNASEASSGGGGWFGPMAGRGHMTGFWSGADSNEFEAPVEGAVEIEVIGTEFAFSPNRLTLTVGEAVNVTFVNDGRIAHDYSIPEFGFTLRAGAGDKVTGSFTPDVAGEFDALCTLPGHAAQGMTATVVVNSKT